MNAAAPTVSRQWVATARAALEVTGSSLFAEGAEILVVPVLPSEPLALYGDGATIWRRLVNGPIADSDLSEAERTVVDEMSTVGLCSTDIAHESRVREIREPWMSSPLHELVYGLVQSIASSRDVGLVFIKGPTLHAQGLRSREHSGDVDVWSDPDQIEQLVDALEGWGWSAVPFDFAEPTYHSVTLKPPAWACEIDLHFRFPGIGVSDDRAFERLLSGAEVRTFAGVSGNVPDPSMHALIFALHLLRPTPGAHVPPAAVDGAIRAVQKAGAVTIQAAIDLGTVDVLRPVLESAFPEERLPADGGGIPLDWQWRTEPNRARYHLAVLRSLPWRERPSALRRIIWPDERALGLSATIAGRTAGSGLRGHLARLASGIRQLISGRPR